MIKVDSLVLARLHAAVAKRVQQQQPSSNKQHSGQPDDILTEIDKHFPSITTVVDLRSRESGV